MHKIAHATFFSLRGKDLATSRVDPTGWGAIGREKWKGGQLCSVSIPVLLQVLGKHQRCWAPGRPKVISTRSLAPRDLAPSGMIYIAQLSSLGTVAKKALPLPGVKKTCLPQHYFHPLNFGSNLNCLLWAALKEKAVSPSEYLAALTRNCFCGKMWNLPLGYSTGPMCGWRCGLILGTWMCGQGVTGEEPPVLKITEACLA